MIQAHAFGASVRVCVMVWQELRMLPINAPCKYPDTLQVDDHASLLSNPQTSDMRSMDQALNMRR